MRRLSTILAVTAVVSLFEAVAHADAPPDAKKRAAEVFAEGQAAFGRADYLTAARSFEEAATLAPHPATLVNAAEAWDAAGDPVRAADTCDRVIADAGADAKYHAACRARLAKLEGRVATLEIGGDGATAQLDGGTVRARKVRVSAGHHVVVFTSIEGRRKSERAVDLAPGETKHIEPTFDEPRAHEAAPPMTVVAPTAPQQRSSGPPAATWIAFGGGALALGATALFGAQAGNARDRFDRTPTTEARDDFYYNRTAANVSVAVAGAAVLIGLAVWVLRPSDRRVTHTAVSF